MKIYLAIALCCGFLLSLGGRAASAASYPIYYTLAQTGRVSLNIYDANGHVVRELLHAASTAAGTHLLTWDGNDIHGAPVANASTCTWKLLSTPNGLTASLLANLGGTYPKNYNDPIIYGTNDCYSAAPLSNHESCDAVTVDSTGIYMAGAIGENVAACIKLSKAPTPTRIWTCGDFDAADGAISLATDNADTLYALGRDTQGGYGVEPYKVFKTHADQPNLPNGYSFPQYASFSTYRSFDGTNYYYAKDLDVCNTTIVLAYPDAHRVCWIDSNGVLLQTVDFSQMTPSDLIPQGVCVASNGTVYVTAISASTPAATGIYTTTGGTPVLLPGTGNLVNPGRLDIDHSNGDIYVITGDTAGNREYVQRYSSAGTLLHSYGSGFPTDGLYDPQRFANLSDVAAMGDGQSFVISEPNYVRRVIQIKSSDGSILNQWNGGLPWCSWSSPDPDDPTVVWVEGNSSEGVNSGPDLCMRLVANYATGTYQIHSVYHLGSYLGTSWKVVKNAATGVKYLCATGDQDYPPNVYKIDSTNWSIAPVTECGYVQYLPPAMQAWAGTNQSYQWNDADGDGLMEQSEMTFYPATWAGLGVNVDDNFTYTYLSNSGQLYKAPVTSWNSIGAPIYGTFQTSAGIATMPPDWTSRYGTGWSDYTAHDSVTDMTYTELQNVSGWDTNTGYARLLKYDSGGNLIWQVGSYSSYINEGYVNGNVSDTQPAAGCINAVRHFPGRTHNCSVLLDFNGGWGNANYPVTYVYNDDGLWVGSLFDNLDPTQQRQDFWLVSDSACGALYTDPNTGAVYYYGTGENQIGVYSITGWNNWETHNGSVVMAPVNIPPVAYNDGLIVLANVVPASTLRATDENGDSLTYHLVTNGAKGTATITNASTGAYTYSPNAGATGTDTFTFKANDGQADSNVATITVSINTMTLWLRADTGVTKDGSNNVSAWTDAITGVTASQTSSTNEPVYAATGMNGQPAIQFDGVDDWLQTPAVDLYAGSSTCTYFVVANPGATQVTYANILDYNAVVGLQESDPSWGVPTNKYCNYFYNGGAGDSGFPGWDPSMTTTMTANQGGIIDVVRDTGTQKVYLDGAPSYTDLTFSPPAPVVVNPLCIGNSQVYPTRTFNGSISEVLYFNRALTDSERQQVEAYLSNKYGLNPVAAPTFTPAPGTYMSTQTVTLSSATSGATIRYTTDGTTPSETVGTVYSGPIAISNTTTLNAIAYHAGMRDSAVANGVYTITQPFPSGAVLWLKADGGVTKDSNNLVSAWVDAIQGITAAQGTDNNKPVFVANGINGLPALQFDGVNDWLETPVFDLYGGSTTASYFVVAAPGASQVTYANILDYNGSFGIQQGDPSWGTAIDQFCCYFYNGGTIDSGYPGWDPADMTTMTANQFDIIGVVRDTGTQKVDLDGTAVYTNLTFSPPAPLATNALCLGNGSLDTRPYQGMIAEVLYFNRALSDTERQQVESYLGAKYSIKTVATPSYTPLPGTYGTAQTVTLACATSGAAIRYTTDGTTPSETAGTVYSTPITIGSTTTLNAIGYMAGLQDSPVTSGVYTINGPAAPTFTPPAGPFTGTASVTISSTTTGASFAYTTDGTTPTESGGTVTHGTLYTGPVTIGTTSTLTAIAFASGYADSSATAGTYTITCGTPAFSPVAGSYTSPTTVTISSSTPGASIAYTTDGTTPTVSGGTITHGTLYTAGIALTVTTTIKAIAFKTSATNSAVATAAYTIKVATPTFNPVAGTYTTSTSETLATTTPGASIAYTTDGTTPTESGGTVTHGTLYSAALNITATTTLKAIAFKVGITDSAVASGTFTIKAATPTFSPAAGTFTTSTSETISSTTPGVSFAYTTDGTTPTESGGTVTHGTLYTAAVNITATTTLKAIAFKVGITDSALASGTFTIKAATPTFSPAAGTFTTSTSVTISSTTPGVSFAYTTDGTTPTESGGAVTHGTLYTAAVSITATTTLKAIAFKVGITDSAVASGTFTIQCAAPTFGTAAGTYFGPKTTTLATATSGASIAYTTDGTTPTESGGTVTHGTLYSAAITLANGTSTVKAIAFKVGLTDSAASSAAYTVYFTQDIGTVGAAGSASLASGTFTVAGAGAGITGTADAFRIVYLPMTGNCTVTAHVASFTSTNAAAMAGVMVRQNLNANSIYAACLFKPQGTVQSLLSVRTTAGGATTPTAVTVSSPYWVRIKRVTNTLTAYKSTDGATWTQIGAATTVTMTGTVYAGLAVTSGTTASTTTATFDNVADTSP